MFKGSIVALVTPFKDGKVDIKKLKELVLFHIASGTSGVVPCGTTGESATLTTKEHKQVIDIVIEVSNGKIPVIAGTGSNSTQEAIELSKYAEHAGADGILLVSPYYNRPTQQGLYLHFKAIAQNIKIPVVLYNIASRTAVNIEPETVSKLVRDVKNIVAIKEASGSLDQMSRMMSLCGNRLTLLSGDDSLTLPILAIGGKGVISVVANIIPKDVADLVKSFEKGDYVKARNLHYKMLPLIKAMFIETNPIPVKTAMGLLNMCQPIFRLPLCPIEEANLLRLKTALRDYGLLK